jgi:hypothetical protein
MSSIAGCTLTGDLPGTHIQKKEATENDAHQNALAAWKSELSTSNYIVIYKAILNPIWAYGIQLWGMASTSNIEILEHVQSNIWHMIVDTLVPAKYGYLNRSPNTNS